MTGTPINLNKARKQRDRAKAKVRGAANAAKHGQTKEQRTLQADSAARVSDRLDQQQLEDE